MEIANIKTTEYPVIDENNICVVSDDVIVSNCYVDDDNNISGVVLTDKKPVKAKFLYNKSMWVFGRNIGRYSNLISLVERTEDERKQIYIKSQEARQANKDKKKTFNDLAKAMLEQTLDENQIKEILGTSTNMLLDSSVASVMLARMIQGAMDGSFKCAEFVRDTAGYRPKDIMQIEADIMTDSDRALIDKLNQRIG